MERGATASSAGTSAALSVTSATSADGGASAKKPSLVTSDAEWDKLRKRDLFPSELVKDSNIPLDVHVKALTRMNSELQAMADIDSLLPVMKKRCILTPHMESALRCKASPVCDKVVSLMLDLKGRGKTLVEELVLCFLDCHESQVYNVSNFYLADGLKRNALSVSGVPLERQEEYKRQQNSVHNAIETIRPDVKLDRHTAGKLSRNLGLRMSEMSCCDLSVVSICERWRQDNPTGRIEHLTRALLLTRGLGRLVSGFCPPTSSNPPIVRKLISGLQKDWPKLAHHLGYTHEETTSITAFYPDVRKQIEMFLRVFQMPNLGDDTESTLLNAIKLVMPRCNTVGLTDQPIQAQAMSGATIINNTKIVTNIVFPPFHPYHRTRTPPSCYPLQSLPRKRSSSEIPTPKLLGFSSESETETDTGSVATTEDSVLSRCISPVSMTGHERGVDHEYSASDSDQEKLMLRTVTSSDLERLQICTTSHYQQRPPEPLTIQMLPTVTGSDLDGLKEYIAPHYQQGPPEPPATQPLIERSTHDRLSSPSDNAPIQPAPTSDDQPTEDNRQKQRQLSKNKQMVQTVTSSDSEGHQEYMASHYHQGPPEPPTTLQQPSIERSTHDQLSSPSYKKIRAPIKPAPTSDDQPTEVNRQKQRQMSKNKQMLQTVTSSELEGLQEYTTPHYQQGLSEPPTTQSLLERSIHDQLSSPSIKKIRGPAPTSGDLPTEDKKLMFMEDFEDFSTIKYSYKDNHRRLKKALYSAAYLLGPMEFYNQQIGELSVIAKEYLRSQLTSLDVEKSKLFRVTDEHSHLVLQLRFQHLLAENRSLREENQRLRQSRRHPMQENRSQFHETPGSTKVSSGNRPSRILQPGFSKRAPGATSGPMRLRRRGHPSKIPVPLHTCPSPSSLQSTTTEESSITALGGTSRYVPSVQATTRLKTEGHPRIVPSTCSSPPSLQSGAARDVKGSVRSGLVQSIHETQREVYVLGCYSPVRQMMIPILAVSISVSRESTQRLCQKLVCDYDGHQFALERRRVRFETTTATVDIISSPDGYEVIPKQTPTEITKEEVDLEGADDLPVYIIFQIQRQWSTSVDQHSIRVRLGVNGLDRPYEYEPVIVLTSSLPSAEQPQGVWINLIVQHLHHKWYELGINLPLNARELHSIERKHSDDIGRCRSVIKKWAHKNGTLNDAAALRRLIEVVRNTDESDDFADLLEVIAVRLNLW